jgi:hypothetical protein
MLKVDLIHVETCENSEPIKKFRAKKRQKIIFLAL